MTNNNFPTLQQAQEIWEDGISYRKANYGILPQIEKEYRFHTTKIAEICQTLASQIDGLNPERAYILGLMHDYGKRINERVANRFHGLEGYHVLLGMGYPHLARICLTHTFPVHDFDIDFYPNYNIADLLEVKNILKDIIYDDYDRLVQYADKLCEGLNIVSFEQRMSALVTRYHLQQKHSDYLLAESKVLKDYFDKLCGIDTYKVLNIKEL